MKKLLAILAISGFMTACNDAAEKDGSAATDTPAASTTPAPEPVATVKDSTMQFKEGKVLIVVGGTWSDLAAAVTTTNGRTVSPNGDVSKNGKTRKMEEGMMIDKDGQMMDKDGKMMDNTGWE